MSMTLTEVETSTTTPAAPLTAAERDALLAQAALSEPRHSVPASGSTADSRAWSRGGRVD